jgi:glucoamylase
VGICCAVAVSVGLIATAAPATPAAQPTLVTGPRWRITGGAPGPDSLVRLAEAQWLSRGTVPGRGTPWQDMVRVAMLDLHRLSQPGGAVAAGAGGRWNYAWPRDTAFVAVALARTGHHGEALQELRFLQRVQLADGGFEARYLLDGSGPPDRRARQSDGAGWALWAASEVGQATGGVGTAGQLRSLVDNATRFDLAVTDDGLRLPPPSPDYWEVGVSRTSLGTVAPLLAGLLASERLYDELGEPSLARRSGVAARRLRAAVDQRFGDGFERFGNVWLGGGGGQDAAVTFLMPPFAQTASPQVVSAWTRFQSDARRPAGGLAPGAGWKQDGISWTPETALVAYTAATSGRRAVAEHWLDWLGAHRAPWGSLPEKVLASGAPAGPAPLAWTASLVILTAAELDAR